MWKDKIRYICDKVRRPRQWPLPVGLQRYQLHQLTALPIMVQ